MLKKLLVLSVLLALPAFAQSTHGVNLAWSASTDAVTNPTLAYNVYRATGVCPASGSPAVMSKVGSTGTLTFADSNVLVGQTYCYVVRAALNGSESADSNAAGGTIPIAPPVGLTVTVK